MCFLKTLKPLDQITSDRDSSTEDSSYQGLPRNFSFCNSPLMTPLLSKPSLFSRQEQLLSDLMGCIRANSACLATLHQKLSQNEQLLLDSQLELQELPVQSPRSANESKTQDLQISENPCDKLSSASHPLLNKLFGTKSYEYRLELQGQIPSTIFKERNINIPLGLVDCHGQKVLNSNIIHLCLGVCDANGEWVAENRAGESFMKGKTEVEMYHGECSFLKVYPRDISRHYPEGKLSFVIYSKPSMLQFSSNASSVEKIVDSRLIEPLLLTDIQIKAKKC